MIEVIQDFLHYVIFGLDMPYVQKAEPISLATLALITAGSKLLTDAGQGFAQKRRAKKQRIEGEQIAQDAMDALANLDYEAGPKLEAGPLFSVSQETRDIAELQTRQNAEAIKNLRDQNRAITQQAIASGVMDPTRASQSIASIAPSLSSQLSETELQAARDSVAAKKDVADLAESYAKANVAREQSVMDRNILRQQQVSDLNIAQDRALQGLLRQEGQTAASLGYAAEGDAIGQLINAPLEAFDMYQNLPGAGFGSSSNAGLSEEEMLAGLTPEQIALGQAQSNVNYNFESGGQLSDQIYVTGGEFNHDTNKKALIDEETGEKEAELTGDEAVLNPEQTENTMEAFKILKDAISKMQNPPEELLAALEKMSHFDEPQFQVPQQEIQFS